MTEPTVLIEDLNPADAATPSHKLPAMLDGATVFLSVLQIYNYVRSQIDGGSVPAGLDTLAEIASALSGKQDGSSNLSAFSALTGAANKLAYFTGAGALSLATLTSFARTLLAAADAAAVITALGLPVSKEYSSGSLSITTSGALTLTHGLGAVPKIVQCELVCLTAEAGYSVGDIIQLPLGNTSMGGLTGGAVAQGASIKKTSTQIVIRFGSATAVFAYVQASTGNVFNLTNANWALAVRAYA